MRKFVPLLIALLLAAITTLPAVAAETKPVAEGKPAVGKAELIDINSASETELKTLPGIGDVYAQKILAGRPYVRKDQLKSKGIIPTATYDKIQDRIIASRQNR